MLGLPTEKYATKVVFDTFIEKFKSHVLTKFTDGKDLMPILDHLKDPKAEVEKEEPVELSESDLRSEVKKWMKQEQIKMYMKRLTTLESNQLKLYALLWGQLSEGLKQAVQGEDDFDSKSESFDCIWLLEKVKLLSAGVNSKINAHCSYLQALTHFCTMRQGGQETNESFKKRVNATAKTVSTNVPSFNEHA